MLYQLESVKSQSSSLLCVEPIATLSKGTFVIWVSKEKWQWKHWIPVTTVLLIHGVNLGELFQCSESQVNHL